MLILKTLDEHGSKMSFLNAEESGNEWWGFFKILSRMRNKNVVGKHYKNLFNLCDVLTDKLLHQKSSGLYELTRHGNVLEYAIKIVSDHEMNKPFLVM